MGALGDRLIDVGWATDENQVLICELAADFADTCEWAAEGYSSAGRWIADRLDMTRRTANEWIRVGRALRELPATRHALLNHSISFTKAKVLTRTATAENEEELIAIAERTTAADLPKQIAAWLQGWETDEEIDERQARARSLTWQTDDEGMVHGKFRLAPGDAATLIATVDAAVMRQSHTAKMSSEADAWPSLSQQRADGLVAALHDGASKISTEVVLHVRGNGCTLDDGTPITESAVVSRLGEAFVRALIHDADRRPINASSRQRHPTDRQKRVVKERDGACVDCCSHDLPEYDHVPDYSISRRTVVEELQLRCSQCHRFRHATSIQNSV